MSGAGAVNGAGDEESGVPRPLRRARRALDLYACGLLAIILMFVPEALSVAGVDVDVSNAVLVGLLWLSVALCTLGCVAAILANTPAGGKGYVALAALCFVAYGLLVGELFFEVRLSVLYASFGLASAGRLLFLRYLSRVATLLERPLLVRALLGTALLGVVGLGLKHFAITLGAVHLFPLAVVLGSVYSIAEVVVLIWTRRGLSSARPPRSLSGVFE